MNKLIFLISIFHIIFTNQIITMYRPKESVILYTHWNPPPYENSNYREPPPYENSLSQQPSSTSTPQEETRSRFSYQDNRWIVSSSE